MEARFGSIDMLATKVLDELRIMAFSSLSDFAEVRHGRVELKESVDWDEEKKRAILELSESISENGGSLKIKMHDKKGALELLGKYLKLYTDRVEEKSEKTVTVRHEQLVGLIEELEKSG